MVEPKGNITVVTDDGVASCILDILRNAKEDVALVSPCLSLSGLLKYQIIAAKNRGVGIDVLIREPDQGDFKAREGDDIDWLLDLGVVVATVESLHAKIYMNEKDLVVSSMNLTAFPTKNARDIALVIHDEEDQRPIREYLDTLADSAVPMMEY